MRYFGTLLIIVACASSCSFSILAANDERPTAETPSDESSSKSGEKPDVTPDAEGFSGVPDAVIDDPNGYVNLRKEKSADSAIIAKVKKNEPIEFRENISRGWDLGTFSPFDPKEYFRQHFPKSAKILFPDYHQRIRDYTDTIKRNPKDSEAYRLRGYAEYQHEDWDRAIADYTGAIELDPESGVAYWNRGLASAEKKEYGAALKDIQKASELQPNEPGYRHDIEKIKALL